LDSIEQMLQVINSPPPQLTIEVKFVEITADDSKALGLDWLLDTNGVVTTTTTPPAPLSGKNFDEPRLQSATNLPPAPMTGILTAPQFRVVLAALEKRRGTDVLSAPKVTTLSERPAQIKVVDVRYIVTDLDTSEKDKIQPIAQPFEFGPVLDVVPRVSADGYSIQMTIIPSVKEFLGYDTNQFQAQVGTVTQIVPLPMFRLRQVVATATPLDGQTVLVSPGTVYAEEKPDPANPGPRPKVRKNLLIFITPTIIDPAGNRVHSEEEMLQRSHSVPPQKPAR
jgi:type II secretory pathway component GspD/PulD (secretin)